jgi:hypothetical protein
MGRRAFVRWFGSAAAVVVAVGMSGSGAWAQGAELAPACSLLTGAELSAVFGLAFGDGQAGVYAVDPDTGEPSDTPLTTECGFNVGKGGASNGGYSVDLTVARSNDPNAYAPKKKQRKKFCKQQDGVLVKGLGSGACYIGVFPPFEEGGQPSVTPSIRAYKGTAGSKTEVYVVLSLTEYDDNGNGSDVTFTTPEAAKDQLTGLAKQILAKL